MADSGVMTEAYTVTTAAMPTANPPAGAVPYGTTVALSTITCGATILYTTDGSMPGDRSIRYNDPIPITKETMIIAIAVRSDLQQSHEFDGYYTITGTPTPTPTPTPAPSIPDLSIKFGITTSGTSTVQHVTQTFNAVHNYLATNPAITGTGADTKIGNIALGDYIDLVSLSTAAYPAAGEGALNNLTNKDDLRLIVVGINSFHSQGSYAIGGAAQDYNDATPHLVFLFQNVPVKHVMNASYHIRGGYAASYMRKYLVNVGGSGGPFLTGLINAGVPDGVLWAPKRYVVNGGAYATAADELQDKLWLPTEWEMFGDRTNSSPLYETETNQARLAYYTGNAIRKKSIYDGPYAYWLASSHSINGSDFCYVSASGAIGFIGAGNSRGVAPAFCVR
jgi:hypothetical protein